MLTKEVNLPLQIHSELVLYDDRWIGHLSNNNLTTVLKCTFNVFN